MSDSEDDYMSYKFLVDCKEDVRPGLPMTSREKRKHEAYKKNAESSSKRFKSLYQREKETRELGLSTAIPSDNKGFKLLEKMGFKSGESLGKSRSGIKEPIDIVIKQGTSGVGRESHLRDLHSKKLQQKYQDMRHWEAQYKMANRGRKVLLQIRHDFFKAQKICEELDYRKKIENPIQEFFWTKDTIKKRRKSGRQPVDDTDSSDEDEEFEQFVTEENLFAIIDYIRSTHLYCLYCVITGVDVEDLKENCPGPYRIDHDNEED